MAASKWYLVGSGHMARDDFFRLMRILVEDNAFDLWVADLRLRSPPTTFLIERLAKFGAYLGATKNKLRLVLTDLYSGVAMDLIRVLACETLNRLELVGKLRDFAGAVKFAFDYNSLQASIYSNRNVPALRAAMCGYIRHVLKTNDISGDFQSI